MRSLMSITIVSAALIVSAAEGRSDETDGKDGNWVCAYDRDSQTVQRLFSVTQLKTVEWLNVSPDGQRLAFSGITQQAADSSIWTCDLDGSDMRDLGRGTMPSWSPGGQRIVLTRTAPEQGIWVMRADGSRQQILDQQGWGAAWSPDGTKIGWYKKVAGVVNIVLHNIAEDDVDLVFGTPDKDLVIRSTQIAWSPDSRNITFLAKDGNRQTNICSVDLQSSAPVVERHLAQSADVAEVSWLDDQTLVLTQPAKPDGLRQLFYAAGTGESAMVSKPMRLSAEFEPRSNFSVSLTRDRTKLFFVSRSVGDTAP